MGSTTRQTTLPMRPSAPVHDNPEDSDPTSSSGSSSSESDSEDSEDENESIHHEQQASTDTSANASSTIPNISGRPKPQIQKMKGNSELLARLSAFLPKMKSANEDLEKEIAAGKDVVMDEVDENKDYIEMNLGLGVLEEKREGDSSGDEADDEDMSGMGSDKKAKAGLNDDILEKLMGGKDLDADKPSIEELGQ
ncbi:hypothetical protein N7466_011159 [Penicillium verhagenii]|uniref:uncharacterized protein n=1 Tax=Penicillium verhagenii TaxID=1562060 RepID=UPI002544F2E1|nr:uncharacterized protein N7466_011159 [Penicillium verhagenii]KAJ5917605.1 hypothetical protein N7466_011159 [Penicillium verhagenii]